MDFQRKRQIKNIVYSKFFLVILFIILFFLGRSTFDIYQKSKLSYSNYIKVKRDYDSLGARKVMLESEINRLATDSGIEEEIRGKFNVAKPGEIVVTIINKNSTSTDVNNIKKDFWSSLLDIFKL
jgi:cell division protein FtsB